MCCRKAFVRRSSFFEFVRLLNKCLLVYDRFAFRMIAREKIP